MGYLMPLHPLTDFEIQKYYQDEPRFNGAYSWNNLPKKIKDRECEINHDKSADVGTPWIALFCNRSELFIAIVLVLNMSLKKLKNLSGIKT